MKKLLLITLTLICLLTLCACGSIPDTSGIDSTQEGVLCERDGNTVTYYGTDGVLRMRVTCQGDKEALRIAYKPDGTVAFELVREYDTDENLTKLLCKGEFFAHEEWTYDKNTLVSHIEYYENGGVKARETFRDDGNISSKVTYFESGAVFTDVTYEYDAYGREVRYEKTYRISEDHPVTYTDWTATEYDENGNVIQKTSFGGSGMGLMTYAYEYLGGRCVREYFGYGDTAGLITEFSYDASGRLAEKRSYDGSTVKMTVVYAYDERGNRLSETIYDAEGNVLCYEKCEYNGAGLLIFLEKNDFRIADAYVSERYEYGEYNGDTKSNCIVFDAQDQKIRAYFYDVCGEPLYIEYYGTDGEAVKVEFFYSSVEDAELNSPQVSIIIQ